MLCFSFPNIVDTDECLTVSPCHANATCNNTEGSYTCTCDSGYSGDGLLCNGRRFFWFNKVIIDKIYLKNFFAIFCVVFPFQTFQIQRNVQLCHHVARTQRAIMQECNRQNIDSKLN